MAEKKSLRTTNQNQESTINKRQAFLDLLLDINDEGSFKFTDEELLDETITFMIAVNFILQFMINLYGSKFTTMSLENNKLQVGYILGFRHYGLFKLFRFHHAWPASRDSGKKEKSRPC